MRNEGGTVDEKSANTNAYARANPPTWIFPLIKHDELMEKLKHHSEKMGCMWKILSIPPSARQLLLQDLQNERLRQYAAPHGPATNADHLMSSQLAASPKSKPSASSAGSHHHSPLPTQSSSAEDEDEEEDEDFLDLDQPTSKSKPKPKSTRSKKTQLLVPKSHVLTSEEKAAHDRVEALRHLTAEEQNELNVEKLLPHLRIVLLPFQLEGVKYLISHGGRGLLADEMGLGKGKMGQLLSVAALDYALFSF